MNSRVKKIFKFIFLTLFVDLVAFTLILPLLPKILDYYATNDISGLYKCYQSQVEAFQDLLGVPESHSKVLLAGILGSWFSLLQFISSPFFGALSDRYGRKPILLLAMSGSVASYVIWFMAGSSFLMFVLSRTIGGLCKANIGLSLAIVSDVSDDSTRGKGMAVVGSSFSLAFISGPLLGAYLSAIGFGDQLQSALISYPSAIAILLALLDLVLVALYLEETNPKHLRSVEKSKELSQSRKVKDNLVTRAFYYINPRSLFQFGLIKQRTNEQAAILQKSALIYFYYLLLYSGLEFTLSFLTHIRFGFTSMQQGKLYLFSGVLMALIQGGYIRRMKGGREALIARIGLAMIIPAFVLMGLADNVNQIYYSLTLYAFSSAVVVPCLTTIVSSNSPAHSRGLVMGTFRSIGALARALGPFLASLLFWTFGPTICYISGALALALPLYLMNDLCSNLKSNKQSTIAARKLPSPREAVATPS